MDLRAFLYNLTFVFLCLSWGNGVANANNSPKYVPEKDTPLIPYEIKFADITFQLTDLTRYLIQTELKNIQMDKKSVHAQLDKMNLFLPIVEPMLKEHSVPNDFKFLVIYNKYQASLESSTLLESGVYWCLNNEKANDVDLLVNTQLDERKHLISATKGAAVCFKRNQVLYRNWGATLFSHLADKKVLNLLEINKKWGENAYLLLDSPAYSAILQFLAYKIAIEREFPLYKPLLQNIVYEYPHSTGKTLNKIALDLKVEPETLAEYNQWLKVSAVPESDCKVLVVVPASRYSEVRTFAELSRKSGLPAKDLGFPILKKEEKLSKTKTKGGIFYLINGIEGLQAEMCDIAVTMAYKSGIPIERFVEYNDMKESDILRVGQVYYIQKKTSKASVPFHVVRESETLWDISQTYGVRLENLLAFNRFETVQRLQRGRVIWLQTTRPKNKPIEYIETPDETPELEKLIVEGQALNIPKETTILPTVKIEERSVLPKEIDLNTLPLSQDIGKGQQKLSNKNDIASTKTALPKEIDINSLPLSQEIRKDHNNTINLPKLTDSKQVNAKNTEQDEAIVAWNKADATKNKLYSVEVASREENKNFTKHTVKKGETLFRISVDYNVAVSDLWVWNNLTSTIVEVGTVLKIKR